MSQYAATAWYWDQDDPPRAWAGRFAERHGGRMPTLAQAGVYSTVSHYLQAADELGTDEALAVIEQMKATPVNGMFAQGGIIREDGRMVHDIKLVRVKSPSESAGDWDYYGILSMIPGEQAFMPLSESKCDLVTQ